jgi:Ulp1 family protease
MYVHSFFSFAKDVSLLLFQILPIQTNEYDCGVWVLTSIVAILRGYHVSGVNEDFMESMRQYLAALACCLPRSLDEVP